MIHRVRIVLKLLAGFGLLIVGGLLCLPGVPGPGILLILLGLFLLSDHFVWARKPLEWCKKRIPGFRMGARHKDGEPRASSANEE